ncbi:MAG: CAP domain-containing protein [Candidatus Moraniibacteriota bacterium]
MKKTTQKINSIALVIVSLMLTLGFVPMTWASEINAENVIRYVNEARSKEGLLELATSEKLTEVAKAKVNDMVTNHYFAHTSPAGLTPWHWFETVGYDYRYAGENLAINFITAESEQAAWMNSPTHRKNIMNVNYQEIGVAVAAGEVNGTLGIIAVQEFGTLTHPGAGSDKKDFAPVKDKALPDTTKFVPTVLSTGDQKAGESLDKLGEKITAPSGDWTMLDGVGSIFWLLLCVVAILPLMIVQLVSFGRLVNLPKSREYFRKLKVRNHDKCRVIKVRVVGA